MSDGTAPAGDDLPDHVHRNRAYWDEQAPLYVAAGRSHWAAAAPSWGVFSVAESDLRVLPDDLADRDTVELGCGTAYISAWLARRGARPVGIDNSPQQLATARRLQNEFGLHFPLHLGNAEQTPFADASFDFAISEYGASIWADPYKWISEAARILRPGGELAFLVNGTIWMLAIPDTEDEPPPSEQLLRPYFGMHRFEWPGEFGVEFHLGYGDMIRLLRSSGFEVEDLIELRPSPDARTGYPYHSVEWSQKWPAEEIWKARKVR